VALSRLHLVFFPPRRVTCVVPRRVAQTVGVPEPPGLSMNFGTLNRGKPDVPEGGIGARRPRDRIATGGFAGSPMTSLERSPDGRAPSHFPPRALCRGLRRTTGGLCPLLSPLRAQIPTQGLIARGWLAPYHVGPLMHGMRACGGGCPGGNPSCVCIAGPKGPYLCLPTRGI